MSDAVYFVGPTRRGPWRVIRVEEHSRYHVTRPQTWRGPFASELEARRVALEEHQADDPHCTCNDCMEDFSR